MGVILYVVSPEMYSAYLHERMFPAFPLQDLRKRDDQILSLLVNKKRASSSQLLSWSHLTNPINSQRGRLQLYGSFTFDRHII